MRSCFQFVFPGSMVLSVGLHAALVLCLVHGAAVPDDFTPPVLIPVKEGRASIRLRPSPYVPDQPTPPQPKVPVEAVPQPEVIPERRPEVVTAPREVLPVPKPAEEPQPQPEVRQQPETKKKPVETPSQPAPASQASEGALPDQITKEWYNPPPPYPAAALAAGQEGTVWLRFRIDAAGRVVTVGVETSSGVPSLDESAVRTARRWLFHPARRKGVPVPFEFLKPVEFSIRR